VALGIAGLAVVDHAAKTAEVTSAEVLEWDCQHGPQPPAGSCARVDPDGIERGWNHREIAYEALFAVSLVAGAAALFARRDAQR
jgi:hypothetical protein